MNILAAKFCAILIPILALLWFLLADANRPTVQRPATPQEQRQTTQAMTGWGASFTGHK
jgi:hypothetical protein